MTDKERFLKARLPERDVDVDGVGTVRVRSLSRAEAGRLKEFVDNPEAGEVFVLATGLVDPVLSEDEVRQWQAAATSAEVEEVTTAILGLSGLLGDAIGDARRSFRPQPGAADGVPPGPDVGDDGGPVA
jgi:hypothetical protein